MLFRNNTNVCTIEFISSINIGIHVDASESLNYYRSATIPEEYLGVTVGFDNVQTAKPLTEQLYTTFPTCFSVNR